MAIPDLDPYRANQFDLAAEWYFGEGSLLAAALFYKDMQSYIINGTGPERLPTEIADPERRAALGSGCGLPVHRHRRSTAASTRSIAR